MSRVMLPRHEIDPQILARSPISLVKEAMNDRQFEQFLDEFFEQIGRGDHLILGISDTTPPAAEFSRLQQIAKRIELFGPVPGE